jgi:O-antigen/teichoic acid export membrane protein
MPSEAKRGLVRITANYLRLISTLALGVILVPLLIGWLGLDGFGLISLVGVSVGLVTVVRELISQSLIREIGVAYHSGDRERFLRYYNSAFVVSSAAALITVLIFAALLIVVAWLNIRDEWINPARWIIAAQGAFITLLVLLAPAYSMYRVKEQFGRDAVWTVLMRATAVASVLILSRGFSVTDTATAIRLHGLLWSSLLSFVLVCAVVTVVACDRRLLPRPRAISGDAARRIFHTFSWNSAANVGVSLHRILAAFLMNIAFGVVGNAVFEVAHRLIGYVRMAASGASFGLEAISVRLSSDPAQHSTRALLYHSTRIQSLVSLPAGLAVFLLAEPLLQLWIGRQLADPAQTIPAAVLIVRILAVALMARATADAWTLILYGAGYVRRYAPWVLAGGLTSPVLGGLLLLALPAGPDFFAPAIGYAVVMTGVHLFVLPAVCASCLSLRYTEVFTPLLRSAFATAACSPLLIVPAALIGQWSLLELGAACGVFGAAYAVAAWLIVLTPDERTRFRRAALRRPWRLLAGARTSPAEVPGQGPGEAPAEPDVMTLAPDTPDDG